MSYLTLKEIASKYPRFTKYRVWDIQCICNYKIRGKPNLRDKERRILRLHNTILNKDEEMRKRKDEIREKYGSLDKAPEAVKDAEIKREWGFWALYDELVEALEKGGFIELLPKQTQRQIDELMEYSWGESGKTTKRKRKSKLRKGKKVFRSSESQGKALIRGMNSISRIALDRFK